MCDLLFITAVRTVERQAHRYLLFSGILLLQLLKEPVM